MKGLIKLTKAEAKTKRVLGALNFEEVDQVPVGESFWTLFVERWLQEKGLGKDSFIMDYYDLDYLVGAPDMSPLIQSREILEETDDYTIFKCGFGSVLKKTTTHPMPSFEEFAIKSVEDYKHYHFEDPLDERRYHNQREDILNCGDAIITLPSYVETMDAYKDHFMLAGGVCEAYEYLWRCRGIKESLMDLALHPIETKEFIERITEFNLVIGKRQIEMYDLKLMYIYGDIAYTNGMFFSPAMWKEFFYPTVKKLCTAFHEMGAKVIYHGCGDARIVYDDLIEAGIDCYHPLEVKAGLDVLELKQKYHKRLALCGNIDTRILASGDRTQIKQEVLRKLNAAKGGGYIIQSDHSIPDSVEPQAYDYMIELVREYGQYPLKLSEYDV